MSLVFPLAPFHRIRRVMITGLVCAIGVLLLAACGADDTPTPTQDATEFNTPVIVFATIEVERASVFPVPDRGASPFTYRFQREQVPVRGVSADGVWLLTTVDGADGWLLRAQVSLSGDETTLAMVALPTAEPPTVTPLPPLTATPTPTQSATALPASSTPTPAPTLPAGSTPTKTLIPTQATLDPAAAESPTIAAVTDPPPGTAAASVTETPSIRLGEAPPLSITLPEGWQSGHFLIPFRTLTTVQDVPLTIYEGPLPGGAQGHIYLLWGFPNIATPNGAINLWADGLQLLRGAMINPSCNLGIDARKTFYVGGHEAVGTFYTAIECEEETDTAGWFAVLQVGGGNFAFFTAVEPLGTLPEQLDQFQGILNSVVFDVTGEAGAPTPIP